MVLTRAEKMASSSAAPTEPALVGQLVALMAAWWAVSMAVASAGHWVGVLVVPWAAAKVVWTVLT
jgi:hypothetical protein